jgi:hypothetical protein
MRAIWHLVRVSRDIRASILIAAAFAAITITVVLRHVDTIFKSGIQR